jgi:hypothetical protein
MLQSAEFDLLPGQTLVIGSTKVTVLGTENGEVQLQIDPPDEDHNYPTPVLCTDEEYLLQTV